MDGAYELSYHKFENGVWQVVDAAVIHEAFVRIHVNGVELATFMCTPWQQEVLALGFLRSEGIIRSLDDIRLIHKCPNGSCVEFWLRDYDFEPPTRHIITSGCGGGITFDDIRQRAEPLQSRLHLAPERICELMVELQAAAKLYQRTRGVHTSALSDGERLVYVAEDVGRHNTIDKLWGMCLLDNYDPADHILLATGRISSEMLNKASKMGVPIVASRTSPTSLSVRLAREWNITLCGYVRRHHMNVYAGEARLLVTEPSAVATQDVDWVLT